MLTLNSCGGAGYIVRVWILMSLNSAWTLGYVLNGLICIDTSLKGNLTSAVRLLGDGSTLRVSSCDVFDRSKRALGTALETLLAGAEKEGGGGKFVRSRSLTSCKHEISWCRSNKLTS